MLNLSPDLTLGSIYADDQKVIKLSTTTGIKIFVPNANAQGPATQGRAAQRQSRHNTLTLTLAPASGTNKEETTPQDAAKNGAPLLAAASTQINTNLHTTILTQHN